MPTTKTTHIEHLCFNNTPISVIEHNNEPWFTSAELAKALGYSSPKSITTIYNRNEIEFDSTESTVIRVMTPTNSGGYRQISTRIFSEDGCAGIAMLAKGPRAIAFRRWVKKVLRDFRFHANGTNDIAEEFNSDHGTPVYEDYQQHTISGHEPVIVPLEFNGQMIPFTFDGGKLWLNCHNLGLILKPQSASPGKAIYNLWFRLKDELPEDGCRLATWSKVGRTSGERVFDLETCKEIALWSGYNDYKTAAALWLREVEESAVSNNANKLLPTDNIIKARALNNLLLERETGDAVHIHELINQFLMQ